MVSTRLHHRGLSCTSTSLHYRGLCCTCMDVSTVYTTRAWAQSCWRRRPNYSTSTSTSFSSSRKPSTRSSTSFSLSTKTSSRSSTRSMVRGSSHSSVDNGHPHPCSMDREWDEDEDVHWWVAGASNHQSSTRSIDQVLNLKNEKFKAEKITVLTTQKYV